LRKTKYCIIGKVNGLKERKEGKVGKQKRKRDSSNSCMAAKQRKWD